ncbi:MAG: hypothetical protein OEW52_10835, partial [Thermoleophilia bacterium]|nr:hypothetical protein [Thermoleophilia bacterium]
RYYVELTDSDPVLPAIILSRTPLTPIVDGLLLDVAGGILAAPGLAALYAVSVVAWTAAGRWIAPGVGLVLGVVLLLYPGYAGMFHVVSSEPVYAAVFSLWAWMLARTLVAPSLGRAALVGVGVAALTLTRPGSQLFVIFALAPLLFRRRSLRSRMAMSGLVIAGAVLPLAGWALLNDARYGEITVARGGNTALFHHAFVVDRIIERGNGPATRQLLDEIERSLLTREPYRSYGVSLDDVLSSGSLRISEDLGVLAHKRWGWDGGADKLQKVGSEALKAHPGTYAKTVLRSIWLELSEPYYRAYAGLTPSDESAHVGGQVNAKGLPIPSEGELIPGGQSGWIVRPDNAIRQVWTSPTEQTYVFANTEIEQRFWAIERETDTLFAALPDYDGSGTLARRLNQLSRWFPRPVVWLIAAVLALAIRRPRRIAVMLASALAAAIVVSATAAATPPDVRYVLPVAPAFILLALGALLGERRHARDVSEAG